jgi:tight adherence protein C
MSLILAGIAAALLARWWRGRRTAAAAVEAARAAVPELLELLVVVVRAGLTPSLAFIELGRSPPPPFGPALRAVVDRLERGERFVAALEALIEHHGVVVEALVTTLVHAERHGDPLGPMLDRLATDGRLERRRQAELRSRRLPVQLSIPLVCCTLPAFVVLAIVPMLAGTFSSFRDLQP